MSLARRIESRTNAEIAAEWDAIASTRHRQIAEQSDLSYHHVLLPTIFRLLGTAPLKNILDVGCGTGHLTRLLANRASRVTGIDPSPVSIDIARATVDDLSNIDLETIDVEHYASQSGYRHDTAVANMVLMDCSNLDAVIESVARVLGPQGIFVATITHPWFWPRYWAYENESWFRYREEVVVQAPFAISAELTSHFTTHFHRPLERYFNCLQRNGFRIEAVEEPFPSADVERSYPSSWQFPRYLGLRAVKDA